jgi:hypothetical protein
MLGGMQFNKHQQNNAREMKARAFTCEAMTKRRRIHSRKGCDGRDAEKAAMRRDLKKRGIRKAAA